MRKKLRAPALLLCLLTVFSLFCGCNVSAPAAPVTPAEPTPAPLILLTEPPSAPSAAAKETASPAEPGEKPEEATPTPSPTPEPTAEPTPTPLPENGTYSSAEDVALFLHTYGRLPDNFISKKEAQKLGWPGGGLDNYAYGKCIGGDKFGNFEGLLPSAPGRVYHECDIGTLHARSRGAERIIFSNDGLIFYTDDHYESFTQLY